jgi:hypothetical protein
MKKLIFILGLLAACPVFAQYRFAQPLQNQAVRLDGNDASPAGTVVSVGISAPVEFNISGSPVTSSGILGLSWVSQSGNLVLASPDNASGILSMRALVPRDFATGSNGECLSQLTATTFDWIACGSGGGAPDDATYITQTANSGLSAEQALSSLSTGIMRVATTTGVITSLTDSAGIAANISDETGSGALAFATSPTFVTPALGTPASGTLTNTTGFPTANLAGAGTGVLTFLATPSSANLASAVTGETGTGALAFATAPALVTPTTGNGATGPGYIDFLEDTDNGSNRVRLLGQSSTADIDVNLPAAAGTILTDANGLLTNPSTTVIAFDDFLGSGFTDSATSGTGAAITNGTSTAAHPGVRTLSTGTTTSGYAAIEGESKYFSNAFLVLGGGAVTFQAAVEHPTTCTSGESCIIRIGICSSQNGSECANGVYFKWREGTDGFWHIVTCAASSCTDSASNTAIATGWHTYKIVCNAGATSCAFSYDGAAINVSPLTATIPSAATGVSIHITKEAGTTARTINADYLYLGESLTTAR